MQNEREKLPPSLAAQPNILPQDQTLEQLEAERDYWLHKEETAPGPASGSFAYQCRRVCDMWIARRQAEKAA